MQDELNRLAADATARKQRDKSAKKEADELSSDTA